VVVAAVPEAAIRWVVRFCASNAELARLSNVSRSWRRLVQQVLWEAVVAAAAAPPATGDPRREQAAGEQDAPDRGDDDAEGAERRSCCGAAANPLPPVSRLLLPCMMRRALEAAVGDGGLDGAAAVGRDDDRDDDRDGETYCVAWFAPEGIQTVRLGVGDERADEGGAAAPAVPAAANRYRPRGRAGSVGKSVVLCPEWRGYRDAAQVLRPFGYADHFVRAALRRCATSRRQSPPRLRQQQGRELLDHAIARRCASPGVASGFCSANSLLREENGAASLLSPMAAVTLEGAAPEADDSFAVYGKPTLAVRGATVARPDEYCCCVDLASTPDERKEREQLLRNVVPRAIPMPPASSWSSSYSFPRTPRGTAVQFLNASMAHAVCMVTPLFPKLEGEPIAIFVVGIATEDGCFVSGLRRRSLEVGHLYAPPGADSDSESWSAVCAAAAPRAGSDPAAPRGAAAALAARDGSPSRAAGGGGRPASPLPYGFSSSGDDLRVGDADEGNDEDGGTERANGESRVPAHRSVDGLGRPCRCPFATLPGKFDDRSGSGTDAVEDDGDDSDQGGGASSYVPKEAMRIHRGVTGPGQWRCYTAVFDGDDGTCLRVDGVSEPMTIDLPSAPPPSPGNRPANGPVEGLSYPSPPRGALDGLTIGADHFFGMSLCCGYGSGGQGQGAISELVVIKGRLDEADLSAVEAHLMAKHGIPVPCRNTVFDRHRDERWTRQAHALYAKSPPPQPPSPSAGAAPGSAASEADEARGVPLRIMARHHAVAWRLVQPVSGQELRGVKIGSRPGAPSSSSEGW
jgi:hypothetical protein